MISVRVIFTQVAAKRSSGCDHTADVDKSNNAVSQYDSVVSGRANMDLNAGEERVENESSNLPMLTGTERELILEVKHLKQMVLEKQHLICELESHLRDKDYIIQLQKSQLQIASSRSLQHYEVRFPEHVPAPNPGVERPIDSCDNSRPKKSTSTHRKQADDRVATRMTRSEHRNGSDSSGNAVMSDRLTDDKCSVVGTETDGIESAVDRVPNEFRPQALHPEKNLKHLGNGQPADALDGDRGPSRGQKEKKRGVTVGRRSYSQQSTIKSVPKYSTVHIYRLDPGSTETDVTEYLNKTLGICALKCEKLVTRNSQIYASFLLTVGETDEPTVLHPDSWPEGTRMRKCFWKAPAQSPT